MSWTGLVTSQPLFQNTFVLKRPRVANFANIIKIPTMFVKAAFKESKKVVKNINYVSKCNLYQYFLIKQKLLISAELKWFVT